LRLGALPLYVARADPGDADAPDREIRLLKNPDGQWTARDLRAGVTAQGESRDVALDNLDAVVEAVEGDGGQPPTDDEIRDLGVDPEVARSQGDELPDVLQ
jgi:predicted RNase H-like HicB family nuclease